MFVIFSHGTRNNFNVCLHSKMRATILSCPLCSILRTNISLKHCGRQCQRVSTLIKFASKNISLFINSGAPYPNRKEKETHKLIFPWLSWLAVLLGCARRRRRRHGVAQHGGHTPANRLTDMRPWFIASFFDIGYLYYR